MRVGTSRISTITSCVDYIFPDNNRDQRIVSTGFRYNRNFPRYYPSIRAPPIQLVFNVGLARPRLPDKEFRYHRTVIVTAAVHTGLSSKLTPCGDHPKLLTFVHWAGVSPYTLPFGFAETCVLVKQLVSIFCCSQKPHDSWQGISLRLRLAILPSSLNAFSPVRLSILYQPTCVGLRYEKIKACSDKSERHEAFFKN